MGCTVTKRSCIYDERHAEWKKTFDMIQLDDSDVAKFITLYQKINCNDPSGVKPLPINIFLDFIDIIQVDFMFNLFYAFKKNEIYDGKIDNYQHFIFALWNFCTVDETSLG